MTVPQIFSALYWAWVATEVLLQVVMRTRRSSGAIKDRGSLLVLLTVIFGSVWLALQYAATHPGARFGGAGWLHPAGVLLLALGLLLRWAAVLSLGLSFSTNVAIHRTQTLRTTGLYRWVRHPSYTAMLVIFAAIGIYEHNAVSLAILLIFPTLALLYRIHVEERALTEAFGEAYLEYSRRTRRLVPGIY
jgi:protein-S-isoprenylcysteine O-methyltransferase Ste14